MKTLIYFCLLLTFVGPTSGWTQSMFEFHLTAGQDNPDDGEERTGSATLAKFELITGKRIFRLGSSFTYLTGSEQFSQGDFCLGPYIYPLAYTSKSPAQPFVFAIGKVGFGTLNDTSRTDAGFGLGAGVDLKMFKRGGFTLAVEQHSASESATRLWAGIFWH